MRWHHALLLFCLVGCDDALLVRGDSMPEAEARDATTETADAADAAFDAADDAADATVEPEDAAAATDGGGALDAATTDARPDVGPDEDGGAPDAGDAGSASDVIFEDDFDDLTFGDDWEVRNGLVAQSEGSLVAGSSCMSAVACAEGPVLLATTELLDLRDGRVTLEYDVFTGINARFTNRVLVDLHAEVRGERIGANPDGSTHSLDAVLRTFWHIGGTEDFRRFFICARCFRPDLFVDEFAVGGDDDAWYHVRARFCGTDGLGLRVTTSTGVHIIDAENMAADASLPSDVREAYLLVWIEGAGKRIDNLVLRRGCE